MKLKGTENKLLTKYYTASKSQSWDSNLRLSNAESMLLTVRATVFFSNKLHRQI